MSGLIVDGVEAEELVQAIHDGLRDAGLDREQGQGMLELTKVKLELKTVVEKTAGVKPKFKVPFFGWEVGGGIEITDSHTQNIAVTLVPPWADGMLGGRGLAGGAELAESFVAAVGTVRDILDAAAGHDTGLKLDSSEITLKFAVTEDKTIELAVPSASWNDAITSTLTFSFGAG